MASDPSVLILTGHGLNCEAESAYAWERAGARVTLTPFNDILAEPRRLHDHEALMFIGGFSYGDHMGSGHVFARRARHRLREDLQRFIEAGKLVLGVCNGFQILVKLGLLPGLDGDYFTPRAALLPNDGGAYQNFWVRIRFESPSPCVFTRGLRTMDLPIRHGEGKFFMPDPALLERIETQGGVACRYIDPATGEPAGDFPHNPNGSMHAIAGLCDPTGRVFGLMPHPEAYLYRENHPLWSRSPPAAAGEGEGLLLFRNAVEYLRGARGALF